MTTISSAGSVSGAGAGFLDKERTIATAGFNRWLVPPAALCIHLCIGMAYGFSVFWLPLSRALGITAAKACPDMSLARELFTTTCDWRVASMGWMYTLFFVLLGIAAAVWGGWLERVGPRKALKSVKPGDMLEVHCTDPLSVIDIPNLIRETGDKVEISERGERRIVFLIEKADGAGAQAG